MKINEILEENEFAEDIFCAIIKLHRWGSGKIFQMRICFFLEVILILSTFALYKWSSVDNWVFVTLFIAEFILLLSIIESGIFLTIKYNNLIKYSICFNRKKDKHIDSILDEINEEDIENSPNVIAIKSSAKDIMKELKEIFKEMREIIPIPDMRTEIDKILSEEKGIITLFKLMVGISCFSILVLLDKVESIGGLNYFFSNILSSFMLGLIFTTTIFCIEYVMEEKELKKNDLG